VYAGAPSTERGRQSVISVDPKNENIVYGSGNSVVIRNIKDPLKVSFYNEHSQPVTVAKYSPSGFYVCSGDAAGNTRIWATDNEDKTLKLEVRLITGKVNDLSWSPDSNKIIVVGEGKDSYAAVFSWDTGSQVGSISGHSKFILSTDQRPSRPFAIVTSGEDFFVNFYKGPPFKTLDQSNRSVHTRYVNCVRFSPDGEEFLSVSSDKTGVFYDGKTGQPTGQTLDRKEGHSGSIYSCAWSPNGKQVVTSSGDKTAKIWNVETKTLKHTATMGSSIDDQQVACVFPSDNLAVSLSLNGTLNFIDTDNGTHSSLHGHNTHIAKVLYSNGKFYTCAGDGILIEWEMGSQVKTKLIQGKAEKVSIIGIGMVDDHSMISVSQDNSFRFINLMDFSYSGDPLKLTGTPKEVVVDHSTKTPLVFVANHNGLDIVDPKLRAIQKSQSFSKWEPNCLCLSPDGKLLVIGGTDKKVHIFSSADIASPELKILDQSTAKITKVAFSPDGKLLAVGDAYKEIIVYETATWTPKYTQLTFHTSAVTDLSWHPDSNLLLSGAVDKNIILWDLPNAKRTVAAAHLLGTKSLTFIDHKSFLTAGADMKIILWNI